MTYTDAELDAFETIFTDAAQIIEDEDRYFELIMRMDPDGSIESALHARDLAAEQARLATLTDQERTDEEAHTQQLVQRGMAAVREIMAANTRRRVKP